MVTGIEMMLKGAGIDVKEMTEDFSTLKKSVIETLGRIDTRLQGIEKQNQTILANQERAWQTVTKELAERSDLAAGVIRARQAEAQPTQAEPEQGQAAGPELVAEKAAPPMEDALWPIQRQS